MVLDATPRNAEVGASDSISREERLKASGQANIDGQDGEYNVGNTRHFTADSCKSKMKQSPTLNESTRARGLNGDAAHQETIMATICDTSMTPATTDVSEMQGELDRTEL